MNYAYIRVSSQAQTLENQHFEIDKFAELHDIQINKYVEETVSGAKSYSKRKLGAIIRSAKKGAIIICSELSRLGRDVFMTMEILHACLIKGCHIMTIKDGFKLGPDLQSIVLAFALALSAAVERYLICRRTKEALQRIRAEGKTLGRPKGAKTTYSKLKLAGKEEEILSLRQHGHTIGYIARRYHVSPGTVSNRLKQYVQKLNLGRANEAGAAGSTEVAAASETKAAKPEAVSKAAIPLVNVSGDPSFKCSEHVDAHGQRPSETMLEQICKYAYCIYLSISAKGKK